ncbi:hypothetical protein D3C78_972440 [compost metagenome]
MQTLREFWSTVKAMEILVCEYVRQLDSTVRTEVQEYDGIAGFYQSYRLILVIHNNCRHYELVKYRLLVRFSNSLKRISILRTFAVNHSTIRFLYALPAFVAVHCIITTLNCCDLTHANLFDFCDKTLQESFCAIRSYVAAIKECMNVYFVHIFLLSEVEHSEQVLDVAVYAAI